MIYRNAIVEWREVAHWKELRFVEQDMIISRALVSIFQDEFLSYRLAFRGGTAIHKLFLSPQVRYSEDIDLVQIDAGPIGQVLDRIRTVMSFLGEAGVKQKANNNTLIYRFETEEPQGLFPKLKIEINCREHLPVYGLQAHPFNMENQWFSGTCNIMTYRFEELIGTKIRALYQRKKGRDLFDIYAALESGLLNVHSAIECFKEYMRFLRLRVPTAEEYAKNIEQKISDSNFRIDILPFLAQDYDYDIDQAYSMVMEQIVNYM
jgi:predicted nucleotidyltransferase component of viral defense system